MGKKQTANESEQLNKGTVHSGLTDHSTEREETAFSQVKRLLEAGETEAEKTILDRETTAAEENEEILQQLYSIYKKRHEWREAKKSAEKLVELNPQKANYYFLLGQSTCFFKRRYLSKRSVYSRTSKTA